MINIIRILFPVKRNSPLNLTQKEYFVETDNYLIAHDKAVDQLMADVEKRYLRYYDSVVMCEINLIR